MLRQIVILLLFQLAGTAFGQAVIPFETGEDITSHIFWVEDLAEESNIIPKLAEGSDLNENAPSVPGFLLVTKGRFRSFGYFTVLNFYGQEDNGPRRLLYLLYHSLIFYDLS